MKALETEPALELDTRSKLYNTVKKNPGLHFREIQRRTKLATGALQYHLDYLEKHSLVKNEKSKNTKRYFALKTKRFEREETVMPLLREERTRHALLFLLSKKQASIQGISKAIKAPYSSTLRVIERLSDSGVIEKKKTRKQAMYFVQEKEQIAEMLSKYRRGFFDSLVDEFVETWKEIGKS